MPPRRKVADPSTAVTYVRVSTREQKISGLGLEAQREKVQQACDSRGWRILREFADEGISGATISKRPGLLAALEFMEAGDAANLVVAKLDRVSRSVHDFSGLLDRASRRGWHIVVPDMDIDTSTASGDLTANMFASFAQFERRVIGERTSAALQVLRANGVQLGRPDRHRTPSEVVERIVLARAGDTSLREIAMSLNEDGVPNSQGGARWYASTVAAVLRRPDAQAAMRAAGIEESA